MRVEDIEDGNSLAAWLKSRPVASRQADANLIARRAAQRVLPLWAGAMGDSWAQKADLSALPILRLNLISAIAQVSSTSEVRQATDTTDVHLNHVSAYAGAFGEAAARAAADAARAASRSTVLAASANHAASYAAATATAASRAAAASQAFADAASRTAVAVLWSEIRADAHQIESGTDRVALLLWSAATPGWFKKNDATARAIWASDPETWSFWLRWWDGVLDGRPLPDDLQLKVALIPDETWKAGPAAVAEAIRVIEARHALEMVISQNPYAWRIVFDPRRQTFEAVAIEPRDLSEIVTSVRGLIKDFHKRCDKLGVGNFGASVKLAFEPVIDFLRRDMRRHAASPLSLLKAIEAARREMQEIADKEHFAGESYLTRFFLGLQDCAEDICVAAPEIVEQLKAKEAVRYELFSMERRRATMLQVFGLHLDADGMLKRVALDALRVIGDDAASDADKKEAWYFATAVLPRAARAYLAETLDKDEELKPPSKVAMTKRVVEAADALAKLDKGKDALTENIPQLADWVNQIVEAVGTWSV